MAAMVMASVMAMDIMDMRKSKFLLLSLTLSLTSTYAQTVIGTPGLMNIPTAEVREGCTFDGGVSLMQKELQSESMNYNTGLYYINFSPFSFF